MESLKCDYNKCQITLTWLDFHCCHCYITYCSLLLSSLPNSFSLSRSFFLTIVFYSEISFFLPKYQRFGQSQLGILVTFNQRLIFSK